MRWVRFEALARAWVAALVLVLLLPLSGCSPKRYAINQLGDALAGGGTAFSSDDDPELIRAAVPFSLKVIESLLAETPEHQGLLVAAASGFTQYSYAFVQEDADLAQDTSLAQATALRDRARKLYLRARDYGLRALEVRHPGISKELRSQPLQAVERLQRQDVPAAYWTAASWAAAIAISKEQPELIADQPVVEAMMDRCLVLDEAFDEGAIHSFMISYEPARQGATGDLAQRCRKHLDRALELSRGLQAGPLVAYAQAVSLPAQNRGEFEKLLRQALAIDVNAAPSRRLVNIIMQRRASRLLTQLDDLFVH